MIYMRLRVMQSILVENVKNLKVEHKALNNNNQIEITQYPQLHLKLNELMKFKFLASEKDKLENTVIYHNKNSRIIVDSNTLNEFSNIVNGIRNKVSTVIEAIDEAIPEQDENSLSIKLPEYVDLTNISSFIKDINTILNQSLVDKYQGTIKLQNFDTGTNWIEVVISNADAIVYFGYIYKAATEIFRKEYLKWKQVEHSIKMLQIEEQAKQAVLKGLEDELNAKAKLNAKMLMEKAEITANQHEYHTNLTKSIIKLAKYLSEGAEVHAALNAPEPVQEVFPDVQETKKLVENSIKLLTGDTEEGTEANNEEDDSSEQE